MRTFAFTSYAQYFLAGLVLTTIGSVMPQILHHYGASYTDGGRLVFLLSVGFLLGVPLSYVLVNRLSEKAVMMLGAALISVGQLGVFWLPPFGWIMGFNFVSSIGVGILETVVATLMMEMFVGRRAVVMSYLEVFFGLGALFMPIAASIFIAYGIWKYVFLVAGVLAFLMVAAWGVISFAKGGDYGGKAMDAAGPPPVPMSKRTKWQVLSLFSFMIFVYTGIEGSLNNFLSSFFITHLGQVSYHASLSIGVFWCAMVAGRAATGWIIRKVTYSRYLLCSMAGTLLGFCCFILWPNPAAGYVLIALIGFLMSGVYSITMVYANHTFPGLARLVTSLVTGFAGLGMAVLPAIVGYTMDRAGTAAAMWFIAGFVALYIAALFVIFALYKKTASDSGREGAV